MALSRPSLIRMRSQVQVLAGPPAIVAGHSAVGSKTGTLVAQPGPRWGRTPIPTGKPIGPPGPSTPAAGATTTTHRGRPPIRGRQPRVGAATSRCRLLPCPTAPPPATGAPHAGLACPEASVKGGRRPHPTRPGSAPDSPADLA